jgi:hypothetical protein
MRNAEFGLAGRIGEAKLMSASDRPNVAPLIIVHEKRAGLARQLRPRLADIPVSWVESRSIDDLLSAVCAVASPIVILELGKRARIELEALIRVGHWADRPLILAVDADIRPGIASLARELGATLCLSGFTPPPDLAALVRRWVILVAGRRVGWSASHSHSLKGSY